MESERASDGIDKKWTEWTDEEEEEEEEMLAGVTSFISKGAAQWTRGQV